MAKPKSATVDSALARPASQVAPFSLLVPVVGLTSASMLLGERLGSLQLGGALLVMIGLGIVWAIVSILLFIITLPVLIVTAAIAALIVAAPFLLLAGLFGLFLTGPLPWVAAGIFMLPLFFTLAFSPWLLVGSWQAVYTSTVWTLTYRELRALPAPANEPIVQPATG